MAKVQIEMMTGDLINVELLEETAPITVGNFLHLIDINFYDGTIFHRIIKGFMSQGGGYFLDGDKIMEKKLSYTIPGEYANNGFEKNNISHTIGILSMARTDEPNSATSQFFICDADCSYLDGNYAVFGYVCDDDSMVNIQKISGLPTSDIGAGFENFPAADPTVFTIKTIRRI